MNNLNRRKFLKKTAAISAVTVLSPSVVFGSKANSAVQMGIIGCGSRGTTVISSISRHTHTNVIAMADLFQDRIDGSKDILNKNNEKKGFPEIQKSKSFSGPDAYLRLIEDKEVDAVLISTPAYAHAKILEAAVEAGKHVYCEKPVAPDVAGCKSVEHAGRNIDGKLSVAIGFQIRYASPYVEMVHRIQRGDIGEIVTVELNYLSSGMGINDPGDMPYDEFRIRNHFHFRAMSGGILLDQGIHMLDVCNWALDSHPLSAIGNGGKKAGPDWGDTWNNFQILYKYPGDINVSIHSTQVGPQWGGVCARFIGTKGIAEAHYSGGVFINGENTWDSGILRHENQEISQEKRAAGVFDSSLHDADANKDIHFIRSIESGNYINEIPSGVHSTLSAILGRDAATSKQELSWDENYFSNSRLNPNLNISPFNH